MADTHCSRSRVDSFGATTEKRVDSHKLFAFIRLLLGVPMNLWRTNEEKVLGITPPRHFLKIINFSQDNFFLVNDNEKLKYKFNSDTRYNRNVFVKR